MAQTGRDSIEGIGYSIFFHLLIEFVKLLILPFDNFCAITAKWNVGGWHQNIDSLPCCCEELHKMMTCSTSGLQHLAVNLEDQRPLAKIKLVQNVNANSTYFAAKLPYFEWTIGAFRRWLKHHGLRAELAEAFSQVLSNGNNLLINSNRPRDCLFIVFNIFFAFSLGIRCFTTVIMNNFTSPFFIPCCTFKMCWTRGLT